MSTTKPDRAQRALIVAGGELAQAAGEELANLLNDRQGPGTAIAIIHCPAVEVDDDFLTAVTGALTAISPPDLATQLAQEGWALAAASEVALILVMDMTPGGGAPAEMLLKSVTAAIHQHLGVEGASLLIWLAGETSETAVSNCLAAPVSATRGIITLGLRNESGLRLPDGAALATAGAELLWVLTATPLRDLPERVIAQQGHAYTGDTAMLTLGLAGWAWSPATTHAAFVHRWLEAILAHWLAAADETDAPEQVVAWMRTHDLSPAAFAARALKDGERRLPDFLPAAWQAPWPWRIRRLLVEMRFQDEADATACDQWVDYACLRMEEPLQTGTAVLRRQIQSILDRQPVAGVSRSVAWLDTILEACDRQIEQMLDQAETWEETTAMLAMEQGELKKGLDAWLAEWPAANWRAWLRVCFRPWRWPRLAWRYWQIRQTGRQLSHILARRASQRRQQIVDTAVRQAWGELENITRRLQSQVEEIGDMLQYLATELATGTRPHTEEDAQSAIHNPQSAIVHLPIPSPLYTHLIPDEEAEAIAAAATIGGLGRQVKALDDALIEPLRRLGAERLAQVWELTAVDALVALADSHEQLSQWWAHWWDAACPLWRLDEAQLDEMTRMQNGRLAIVCGADANLLADLLPEQKEKVCWLPSGDRERLLLVRIHAGLTAKAMADYQNRGTP